MNQDKYVGCGLCVDTCPEKALSMVRFERENIPGAIS
ncbi:MAG: 4Fe-4S binding protein [Candidatus Hermodarchaeota archaeon]